MKSPKGFRGRYFSLAAILALSTTVTLASTITSYSDSQSGLQKQDEYALSEEETPPQDQTPVVIITKKIKTKTIDAPFASEIYTKAQIKKSHAKNLYEFLNTQTSVSILPSYGNKFSPLIDMRGYGVANGYQNIVVTVNGERINNIDGSSQLLASIPLQSVQKIEIIKGSGSVEYGDGANAGVINIITKDSSGVSMKTYIGSHGAKFGSVGIGIKQKKFSVSGYIDNYSFDGARLVDALGNKDKSWSRNKYIDLIFNPLKDLRLKTGKHISKNGVVYAKGMTYAQYMGDINSVNKGSNTGYFDSDKFLFGFDYRLKKNLKFGFDYSHEKKTSTVFRVQKYDYKTYDSKIKYNIDNFKAIIGVQKFNGDRKTIGQDTTKDNLGGYAKIIYQFSNKTISLGTRVEKVDYTHKDAASHLKSKASLNAFDIGYNYKIDNISSVFINYNKSFQAPNIDMFFKAVYVGGVYNHTEFNGFIKPMNVRTINVGYNYLGYPNRAKFTVFYSSINDEIYYDGTNNTNLDKTRKYGLELYDKYNILYNLYTTLNYSYLDTKIRKNTSKPSIVGNGIPGVSRHNIKLALGYNPTHRVSFLLSHTYKSKAYAMSDFDQSLGRQDSYNSTDLSVSYKYKKVEFFAKINDLFDKKNALFVDGAPWSGLTVYPVNYERTFMIGVNARF